MNYGPYYGACNECRLCEGAAYQMPPFLYAGSDTANILIIAQNPGEIGAEDKWRPILAEYAQTVTSPMALKTIYDIDFVTSHGHQAMAKIFGEGWLMSGKFMYTNAVRCRTEKNAAPSEQMVKNCMAWTAQLALPSLVVLMGGVARQQFCEMVKKPLLEAWKVVRMKRGDGHITIVTIPHYAAMRSGKDVQEAKELFESGLDKAGLL